MNKKEKVQTISFTFDTVYNRVKTLSQGDGQSIENRILKLQEEVGEASADVLMMRGYKHNKKNLTFEKLVEELNLEAVDILIVAFDLMAVLGISNEKAKVIFDEKMKVWETQQKLDKKAKKKKI